MRAKNFRVANDEPLAWFLFILALVVYAATRLTALDQFPIYFFTDEAIHPVYASELIARGFRDAQDNLFPSYFQNGLYWNLSLSVYLHTLPVALVGKSILATRAFSAIISILSAVAVSLSLKLIFKIKTWWLGALILAATPAWFLHSRTAFETGLMVSFYACFLLCYSLYRYRSPRFLFPALVFGAATFYAYANGQAVMGIAGVLFLLSDLRYHLKNWRVGIAGIALLVLLAAPYLRFRLQHPDEIAYHLRILNSYWLQTIPLAEKIQRFISTYSYGLSPAYWFLPNGQDLERHRWKDSGHLALWMLPFFLLGVTICLRRIQSSAHRALLIAALAAPFGSAFADIGITRVLAFVIPATAFAALGFDALVERVRAQRTITVITFVLLTAQSFVMLGDALFSAPTWYTNYGLYGMQWGAKQIFQDWIPDYLQRHPGGRVNVTHIWSNGADVFARFFALDPERVRINSILAWIDHPQDLSINDTFVMTQEEYVAARASQKFRAIEIEDIILYPNGSAGFYVAHVTYVNDIQAIFAAERAARQQLVSEMIARDGQLVQVSHTPFDSGNLQMMLDGDPFTLARGASANPFTVEFAFPTPRALGAVSGLFGKTEYRVTALVYADTTSPPIRYEKSFDLRNIASSSPAGPSAEIVFDRGPASVSKIRLEILYLGADDQAHIHIFDLNLR